MSPGFLEKGGKFAATFCKVIDLLGCNGKSSKTPIHRAIITNIFGKLQRYAPIIVAMLLSDFIIAKEFFVLKESNEHFQDAKA